MARGDIGEALLPLLARIDPGEQPLAVALAERMAAVRYRSWAGQPELAGDAEELRRCAEREEEIATRIEATFADAGAIQARIRAQLPELDEVNRKLFDGRPLREQLDIQARGERLGAATWRNFAGRDPQRAEVFAVCAELEEASARVLEAILARSPRAGE